MSTVDSVARLLDSFANQQGAAAATRQVAVQEGQLELGRAQLEHERKLQKAVGERALLKLRQEWDVEEMKAQIEKEKIATTKQFNQVQAGQLEQRKVADEFGFVKDLLGFAGPLLGELDPKVRAGELANLQAQLDTNPKLSPEMRTFTKNWLSAAGGKREDPLVKEFSGLAQVLGPEKASQAFLQKYAGVMSDDELMLGLLQAQSGFYSQLGRAALEGLSTSEELQQGKAQMPTLESARAQVEQYRKSQLGAKTESESASETKSEPKNDLLRELLKSN